jgi:hypothetical protein
MADNAYLPPFTPLQQKAAINLSQFHHPSPSSPSAPASIQLPPLQRTPPQAHHHFFDKMAASTLSTPSRKLTISKLMSPPEHILDSFNHGPQLHPVQQQQQQQQSQQLLHMHHAHQHAQHVQHHNQLQLQPAIAIAPASTPVTIDGMPAQPMLVSPPISPYVHASSENSLPAPSGMPLADPILYPNSADAPHAPQSALFPLVPIAPAPPARTPQDDIIDNHIAARETAKFGNVEPPTKDEYRAILSFKFIFTDELFNSPVSARHWLSREKDWLIKDRRMPARRVSPKKTTKPKTLRAPKADRVLKPSQTAAGPRPVRANPITVPPPARIVGPIRTRITPEPHRRTVAPNREDKNFASLPDYCPPLDSLPPKPHCMKIDWKGQPIDLSKDPNRDLLHAEERELAGSLRLDCATYLTSKRRIFERRLECARTGKEFRKTDAQQACNIDVNKASKLWLAFDKVGWLDVKWVHKWL